MPRPRRRRQISFDPEVTYFKPPGIPLSELAEVELRADELEALRLHDLNGLDQSTAANMMQISQPTFARTLQSAYTKLADALIGGKAIKLCRAKDS